MFAALCPLLVEVLTHFAANNVKNYATASHSFHNFVCEQIIQRLVDSKTKEYLLYEFD